MSKAIWGGVSNKHIKPWGTEVSWTAPNAYGKILTIGAGKRLSFKMNKVKTETLFVVQGRVSVDCADQGFFEDPSNHPMRKMTLSQGECLNVQSECPYRITAEVDSIIFEIGDTKNHSVIRIIDDYGREDGSFASLAEIIIENS
jgi:mannose-6-phosphate isomerase-like protein (cupin superfamily)